MPPFEELRVFAGTAHVELADSICDYLGITRGDSEVFKFFASSQNLERLTQSFLRFSLRKVPAEPLRKGSTIDYQLRLHGVPVWWRTRIEEWCPPLGFTDVQVWGPFRRWHHRHEFVADGPGTLIKDTVDFDIYCRSLYRTPVFRWIDSDLVAIFEYRQKQIDEIFDEKV